MMLVRRKRLMLRLYFILVIVLALVGYWYADRFWQVETEAITTLNLTEETNWVDFFAGLGEGAIQLFLGFTSN